MMATEGAAIKKNDDKTVKMLSDGLLDVYEKPLLTIKTSLKELTDKQESLIRESFKERRNIDDASNSADTIALIADLMRCRERLLNISKMMTATHKRTTSLQTRALSIEKAAIAKSNKMQKSSHTQRP